MEETITLTLDDSRFYSALSELKAFAELFPEVGKCLVSLLDSGAKLFRVHVESDAASGASELRTRLEPTDFMLGFLAALRARDGDQCVA